MIDSVYQNYTLMNTREQWWHMFCTNVYLTTPVEVFNLEHDEIKSVLVMLVASNLLNKVICTRNILETYLGAMYL